MSNSSNSQAQSDKVVGLEGRGKLRALSEWIGRTQLGALLGMTFGGKRDLYEIFGYKKNLTTEDLISRYVRQDIAGRIVELYSAGTWTGTPTFVNAPEEFNNAWIALTRKQRVWNAFNRADRLANLGEYSIMLLGFDDSGDFSKPVKAGANRRLLYVRPLAQHSAQIQEYDDDPRSERYGLPTKYKVSMKDNSTRFALASPSSAAGVKIVTNDLIVHWTRIVHVVEDPLEDDIRGNPRLIRVYNLLDDLIKVTGGSAETFWLTANRGLQVDIDKEMQLDPDDAAQLSQMVEDYQHQQRRILRTRGVKVNVLGSDVPDPTGAFLMLQTMIAGAAGIPRRILFGSEAGQLASEQDRASWARRLTERRDEFATPRVMIPFVVACQNAGVLPEYPVESMEIQWPDAFHLSPLEKGQAMAQVARAAVNMSRQVQLGFPLMNQEECRQVLGLEGTIDQNDIELTDWYLRTVDAEATQAENLADEDPDLADDATIDEGGNGVDATPRGTATSDSDRAARQRE